MQGITWSRSVTEINSNPSSNAPFKTRISALLGPRQQILNHSETSEYNESLFSQKLPKGFPIKMLGILCPGRAHQTGIALGSPLLWAAAAASPAASCPWRVACALSHCAPASQSWSRGWWFPGCIRRPDPLWVGGREITWAVPRGRSSNQWLVASRDREGKHSQLQSLYY